MSEDLQSKRARVKMIPSVPSVPTLIQKRLIGKVPRSALCATEEVFSANAVEILPSKRARVELPSVPNIPTHFDVQERLIGNIPQNALCATQEVLSADSKENLQSEEVLSASVKENLQSNRARVELPSLPIVPTLLDVQERLMCKVQILKTELPKAQNAFCTIEEVLSAKAKGFRYTDFRRATELAVLVSRMKVLSGSLRSMIFTTSKNPTNDKAWFTVAMAVMGSGAIGEFIMKLITDLGDREDTRDIDCSVVADVCASIHEITKDIADSFQVK